MEKICQSRRLSDKRMGINEFGCVERFLSPFMESWRIIALRIVSIHILLRDCLADYNIVSVIFAPSQLDYCYYY